MKLPEHSTSDFISKKQTELYILYQQMQLNSHHLVGGWATSEKNMILSVGMI